MSKKKIIIALIILIVLSILTFGYLKIQPSKKYIIVTPTADSVVVIPNVPKEFGIAIDSFEIVRGKIKRNQSIAKIFNEHNIDRKYVHHMAVASKDVFDLRKIRMRNAYSLYYTKDTTRELKHFVYEHSPLQYLKVSFQDSASAEFLEKETDTVRMQSSGSIKISLWESMLEKNYNPILANELSEIYAWSVNFFGLQKGDSFNIVYDEIFVDTISIGIGKVYTSYFRHADHDFYAIPFIQDSVESFFDERGNSLKKAFLKAPLKFSRVSSGFSNARFHPVYHVWRPHHGVDFAAPSGTPVHSVGDGKVMACSYKGGNGYYVTIQHNSVFTTMYLHLKGFGPGIKNGVYVKQGQIIGYVGSTGASTGPHLDFRLFRNGHAINPLTYEPPPVEPVKEENIERYDSVRTVILKEHFNITLPDSITVSPTVKK